MKNNMLKRLLVLSMTGLMITGLLAGCGKEETKPSVQESSVASSEIASTESKESSEAASSESTEVVFNGNPAENFATAIKAEMADGLELGDVFLAVKTKYEDIAPYAMDYMEVEEGYLNGFDDTITGFNKGITFGPIIGSVPFVGYIFETDDAAALEATLRANANPRWNICTEADITYAEAIDDNHLVFLMTPASFEDDF